MTLNCDCSDATGYRALGELRTELFDRLGFVDPMANIATRTLALLRADLATRLGYAAQVASGSYPPGVSAELDSYVNEAQQTLFRRLELDKGTVTLPARLSADGDLTTLDYVPVFNLALAMVKAHKGHADAKVYFEVVEKYLSDTLTRRPPNAEALCSNFITDAQRQVIRRYPAVRMDRWFTWNLVEGERFYDFNANDRADFTVPPPAAPTLTALPTGGTLDAHGWDYVVTFTTAEGESLPSAPTAITTTGGTSRVQIEWVYPDEQPGCLPAITGANVYGRDGTADSLILLATVAYPTDGYIDTGVVTPIEEINPPTISTAILPADVTGPALIDTLAVKWVGVTWGTQWVPMRAGIPPGLLGTSEVGRPRYYQLRQCLEVWPAPADSTGTIQVRAGFMATRFTEDSDLPSIDDELVFLHALASAKAHFKRPDAQLAVQQFETHLRGVVAGSHGPGRHIPPGRSVPVFYTEPAPTVPFA